MDYAFYCTISNISSTETNARIWSIKQSILFIQAIQLLTIDLAGIMKLAAKVNGFFCYTFLLEMIMTLSNDTLTTTVMVVMEKGQTLLTGTPYRAGRLVRC